MEVMQVAKILKLRLYIYIYIYISQKDKITHSGGENTIVVRNFATGYENSQVAKFCNLRKFKGCEIFW